MPRLLLIFSRSEYLIKIVDINSQTEWQTVQIQISWLLMASQKPSDLDLHCLQMQGVSGFSRTRVKINYQYRNTPQAQYDTLSILTDCHITDNYTHKLVASVNHWQSYSENEKVIQLNRYTEENHPYSG